MGEIAILHAPDSRTLSVRLAAELAAEGHSVLRREGGAPTATAHAEIANFADAVIVLWSPAMADHPSMIDAARRALARRALVPARVLDVAPPASFAHLWPIDLDGWSGETEDPRWQFVKDEIALAMRRSELTLGRAPARAEGPARETAAARGALMRPTLKIRFRLPEALRRPPLRRAAPAAAGAAGLMLAVGVFVAQLAARSAVQSAAPNAVQTAGESAADSSAARAARRPDPRGEAPPPIIAYVEPIDPPGRGAPDVPLTEERLDIAVPAPPAEDVAVVAGMSGVRAEFAAAAPAPGPPARDPAPDEISQAPAAPPAAAGGEAASEDAQEPPAPPPDDFAGLVFRDCVDCPDMTEIGGGAGGAFAISRREITHDDWRRCVADGGCRPIPAPAGAGRRPAAHVSYLDAAAYADWLTAKTGFVYRLPSAGEWSLAASAPGGPAPAGANLAGGPWGAPLPAGSFRPSANGLYDMIGNVWEWTSDCSPGETGACARRLLKGGAYDVAFAGGAAPTAARPEGSRAPDAGFRVVRIER